MKLIEKHIFTGLLRDTSPLITENKYLYDARNIRFNNTDEGDVLSITNEKGPAVVLDSASSPGSRVIFGCGSNTTLNYLGSCILNNYLIVFTKNTSVASDLDRISVYNKDTNTVDTIFSGNLNFNFNNPILALGYYESEKVLKVYWVDGLNLPRVINIVDPAHSRWTDTSFDFYPKLLLDEDISIVKLVNTAGQFEPGVIQYAFTYYNKFGQESSIFYTSPLLYISHLDRGGKPNTVCNNSFRINIENIDTHFDYLRIYSIHRTTLNGTPLVKKVTDLSIEGNQTCTYTGEQTFAVDEALPVIGHPILRKIYFIPNIDNPTIERSWDTLTPMAQTSTTSIHMVPSPVYPNSAFKVIATVDGLEVIRYIQARRGYYAQITITYTLVGSTKLATSINASSLLSGLTNVVIKNSLTSILTYIDNGVSGEALDPTELLYKSSYLKSAGTLTLKDNTLFLGNLLVLSPTVSLSIISRLLSELTYNRNTSRSVYIPEYAKGIKYSYSSTLNLYHFNTLSAFTSNSFNKSTFPAGFKKGLLYRLGVLFLDEKGMWTLPIFLKDILSDGSSDGIHFSTSEDSLSGGLIVTTPKILATIPSSLATVLSLTEGFIKARPVVVFPKMEDKTVLCQGVACATMYTYEGVGIEGSVEGNHSPDYLSSWFFRSSLYTSNCTGTGNNNYNENNPTFSCPPSSVSGVIPYNTFFNLAGFSQAPILPLKRAEIEGAFSPNQLFRINWNYCTLHSPDIELNSYLYNTITNLLISLNHIGLITFEYTLGNIDIQTESPTISNNGSGLLNTRITNKGSEGASGIISGLLYEDFLVDDSGDTFIPYERLLSPVMFLIYPWLSIGSLNNDYNRTSTNDTASAKLKKKVLANTRIAITNYASSTYTLNDSKFEVFSSNEVSLAKVNNKVYYGNIDTLLCSDLDMGKLFNYVGYDGSTPKPNLNYKDTDSLDTRKKRISYWWGFVRSVDNFSWYEEDPEVEFTDIMTSNNSGSTLVYFDPTNSTSKVWRKYNERIGDKLLQLGRRKSNIRMKYKSSPHIIFYSNGYTSLGVTEQLNGDNNRLPIIELSRPLNATNCFGGTSSAALQDNIWYPAGEPVNINTGGFILDYIYGDTWYSCYDCLKTYPTDLNDVNLVIEIGSFKLESFTNVDGRYDRHMWDNDISINKDNFNLINPVYSLLDNFFNYRILDNKFNSAMSYPNLITWSLLKSNSSDIDLWTHIALSSVHDLDGTKGSITKIVPLKDLLYVFLERGISSILFNNRVLIPTSDGAPIEITNNYKVEGTRLLSENLGSSNADAICSTSNGIYFIDNSSKSLFLATDLFTELSKIKNMLSWFKVLNSPMKLFYDNSRSELYIVTNTEALVYNNRLLEFTSFYDYNLNSIPTMFNVDDEFYCIHNYWGSSKYTSTLYSMFDGSFNNLFSNSSIEYYNLASMSYYIEFIARGNGDKDASSLDKTFDNMEFRADLGAIPTSGLAEKPFNTILVLNNYLNSGLVNLTYTKNTISNLKKKFDIWRVTIPRNNDTHLHKDRIRSPWCKIKLYRETTGISSELKLYDIDVISYIQ